MHPWIRNRRRQRPAIPPRRQIIDRLADKVASPPGAKALMSPHLWDTLVGNPHWTEAGALWRAWQDGDLERLYRRHSVIYACVRRVAQALTEASAQIVAHDGRGREPLPDHPLQRLIDAPNPNMSWSDLLSLIVSHLLLSGESYVLKERAPDSQQVRHLLSVPPSWVHPQVIDSRRGWEVRLPDGRKMPVLASEVIVLRLHDPASPGRACAPLQAALRGVQLDEHREDYMLEMLSNLQSPGVVLYQNQEWTDDQRLAARAALEDQIGPGQRGAPLFLSGDQAKVEAFAPLRDLDWPGLTGLTETRICAAFGVPPIVLGLRTGLENATYSNYQQAERSFYRGTLPPLWRLVAESFTRELVQAEADDPHLAFHFDTGEIAQLQEDATQRADRAARLFAEGIINRNEARRLSGLPPLEDALGEAFMTDTAEQKEGDDRADSRD
jgi:HK97 family phage portal protein